MGCQAEVKKDIKQGADMVATIFPTKLIVIVFCLPTQWHVH